VTTIALGGITAHIRLPRLLESRGGGKAVAKKILFAWLVANLFLGSQLC